MKTEEKNKELLLKIGSKWNHRNGNTYTITAFTNLPDGKKYPLTVVYQGYNGCMWSRLWSDWHRSMTPVVVPENPYSESHGD